jgi:hypothetical protein
MKMRRFMILGRVRQDLCLAGRGRMWQPLKVRFLTSLKFSKERLKVHLQASIFLAGFLLIKPVKSLPRYLPKQTARSLNSAKV